MYEIMILSERYLSLSYRYDKYDKIIYFGHLVISSYELEKELNDKLQQVRS